MAGARCAGRRWYPFLFLVDAQPDAVHAARRTVAGARYARAHDRRKGAGAAACSSTRGASAQSAACGSNACASAGCSGARARSFTGRASNGSGAANAPSFRRNTGHRSSTTLARSLDASTSDSPAGSASPRSTSARGSDSPTRDGANSGDPSSSGGRNG